jgi:hypothetical protein
LSDEYQLCIENVGKTSKIVAAKEDAVPDLRKAVTDASARYKNAQKAVEKKTELENMKKEVGWAYVRDKQNVSLSTNGSLGSSGELIIENLGTDQEAQGSDEAGARDPKDRRGSAGCSGAYMRTRCFASATLITV